MLETFKVDSQEEHSFKYYVKIGHQSFNLKKNQEFLSLNHLDPLVHKEGLYVWHEVVTPSALLIACNLGGLLSPHYQCQGKHHSLYAQF